MTVYVSMLRGINVGGQKKVNMNTLRELYQGLGFSNVQTYIQSGNVVFESHTTNASKIASIVSGKILESLGYGVHVFIRTRDEFQKVIEGNPLPNRDNSKLYVIFLSDEPSSVSLKQISIARDKGEVFALRGREVYLFCPNGYGRTKLNNNFFETKLKVFTTTRNWNTVNTLLRLAKNLETRGGKTLN
jgi:uncharacterized protein (DUF1697 family)